MKNNENGQSAAKQYTELKDIPGFEGSYAVNKMAKFTHIKV